MQGVVLKTVALIEDDPDIRAIAELALGEIGGLRLGKIEKKGRLNRRVYVHLGG